MSTTPEHYAEGIGSGRGSHLVIGLVNNMPDGALRTTERQFRGLLNAASHNFSTSLRYFSLPGVPRGAQAQTYIRQCYENIDQLWLHQVDALIVTGTEPRARELPDEPYWPALSDLVDGVNKHAIPTIWSCLAAHAAVLHTDGIHRRPLREKLCGVFECQSVRDHEIIANGPKRWCVPHSRQNELPEEELLSKGYSVLSRSPEVGADIFIREHGVLSIFLQGHPEYDPEALFLEYRRDVRRFLMGERSYYPAMPRGYFDANTVAVLTAFQTQATSQRSSDIFLRFPEMPIGAEWAWRDLAVQLYSNWLSYIRGLHNRSNRRSTTA
jgi:homoserine O-succinyltransferase